jgi:hypothetical protein
MVQQVSLAGAVAAVAGVEAPRLVSMPKRHRLSSLVLDALALTGLPSSRLANAATIRVPSVGLALATSTITWSSESMYPGPAAVGRRLWRRYNAWR